jgi:hypothetical protein
VSEFFHNLKNGKSVAIRQLRGMVPQLGWTEMQQLEKISDAGKCTTILVKL